MKKIILNVTMSLDGFMEGSQGEIDWCFTDQDYGMAAFLDSIDSIFYGRKSYELMLTMGENPFPGKRHYVFSRSLSQVEAPYEWVQGEWREAVDQMRAGEGKGIWLFGGAQLLTEFMNAGLVDELLLAIHPLVMGGGAPLFQGIAERHWYEVVAVHEYNTGMVQVHYRRKG